MMKKLFLSKLSVLTFFITTLILTDINFAFAAEATAVASNLPTVQQTPFQFIFGTVQFFLIAFFVYYMLVLRPQQLKEDTQAKFISELKKDTEVVTTGGILGKVSVVSDDWITVEISSGVKIKIKPEHVLPKENKNLLAQAEDNTSSGKKKSSTTK